MKIDSGAGAGTTPGRHSRTEAGIQTHGLHTMICRYIPIRHPWTSGYPLPAGIAASGVWSGITDFVSSMDVGDSEKGEPRRHSGVCRNPESLIDRTTLRHWIPAFAGIAALAPSGNEYQHRP